MSELSTRALVGWTEDDAEVLKEYSKEFQITCEWGYDKEGIIALFQAPDSRKEYIDFVIYLTGKHLEKQAYIRKLLKSPSYCRQCRYSSICGQSSENCLID